MCISKLVASLLSTACLVPVENHSHPQARHNTTLAAVAGSYYYGDGLGMNFTLVVKAEGRFSFMWRGCLGVYGKNEGGAKVVNNHLILKPEQPNESRGIERLPTDLVPVRWGERLYLVPKEAGKGFCDDVNNDREPRSNHHGDYYLREGDWGKKVTGLPNVPKEWESLLQKKPIENPK
jgi:hypothetical protein